LDGVFCEGTMSSGGSGSGRYCAIGFGSNFFFPLGSEAIRVPAGLLPSRSAKTGCGAAGAPHGDGGRNRGEGAGGGDGCQHDDADHGRVCLLAINPRGSALQVPSFDEDDGADQEQAPPSSSPSEWLESRLVPPGSSPSPGGGGHTRYSSSELPSASCGVTHTSYVIPKPGSGTGRGEAHLVGTMFGRTHRRLALQPTRLPLRIARVASGRRHVLALTEGASSGGGVVMSWGAGHFGQLGHGPELTSCTEPRIIERLLPHNVGGEVTEIAAGGLHSAAIVAPSSSSGARTLSGRRGDGSGGEITVRETRTFAWGSNRKGQCGIEGGKCATVPEPTPVIVVKRGEADGSRGSRTTEPVDRNVHFEKLALGRLHTVALTAYGEVFTWGSTSMGRCGHTSVETGRSSDRRFVQQPRHVSALRNVVVEAVAAGAGHTMALSRGGRVFAWGAGGDGQCGQGHAGNLFSPRPVEGLPSASNPTTVTRKRSSAGGDGNANSNISDVCGKVALEVTLEEESLVKQLSQGARITQTIDEDLPTRSDRIVAIRASGCYSAALSADGDVYTWGYAGGVAVGHEVPPPSDLPLIPLIEGNQYSTSTAAKVYPAGASAENKARDAKCFDTSLNVMLPRRVEATDALGLRVEEVALGPGHMVLLCSRRCDAAGPPGGRGSTLDPDDCDDDGGCNEAGIEVGHFSDTAQTETATDSTFEDTASLTGGAAAQVPPPPSGGTDGSITRSYSLANSTGTGSTNDSPDELTYSQASSVAEPQPSATRSGGGNAGEKKRRTTKGAAGGLLSKLKSTGSSRRRLSFGSGGEVATGNGGGGEGGGGGKRKSSSAIGKMMGMAKRDGS